ncbi:MAG TPA: 4-hydroxy-tetrahydrodipicolinate reductase [Candidatus Alistipes excrementipullorum]|nr:4-hydroxy-tetrahydrodipicolinate reductase [Candidatus Alistipes excrementipullorum]
MKAAIIGYGKMGHEIETLLRERGHEVVLIVDADNTGDLDAEHLRNVDVALEFTSPATAYGNICRCLECGTAVVSGTTGWTDRLPDARALCDKTGGALFYASNYSLGVNLLFRLNRRLAEMMNPLTQYDVRIEETHHIQKKDAPSGTAITLADEIIERLDRKDGWVNESQAPEDKIAITSYREGMIAGIHTVTYESEDDILELKHTIKNRRTLALGAVVAAEFLCGKSGFYTMDDLLNQ